MEQRLVIMEALGYEPWAEQAAFHFDIDPETGEDRRHKLVTGGEQAGKPVHIDTPIPTPDGWRTMGEIRTGDRVFDEQGLPTRVVWHSYVEQKTAYRITFDTGESIIAGAEHLWYVQNYNARKHGYAPKVRTTEEMALKVLVPAPHNKRLFANWSIPATKPAQYEAKPLPVDPYILGAWLVDGTRGCGGFTCADPEILAEIERRGQAITRQESGKYRYNLTGLLPQFRSLGVLRDKHIPDVYLQASVGQRWDLLRGLMDTDGYVDKRGRLEFNNTNKRLVDGFVELVASLGLSFRVREKRVRLYGKDCGPCWIVVFQTKERVFNLTRKADRQKPEKHSVRSENVYITAIEPAGIQPVKCIGVEASSHLFLCGRTFIPTHNSFSAAMELMTKLFWGQLFWIVAPDYSQAENEFNYLEAWCQQLGVYKSSNKPQKGSWQLETLTGQLVVTKSTQDVATIAGKAPDGILFVEAAQAPYEAFLRCYGRTGPKRGWLCINGTFEKDTGGWFRQLWKAWQVNNRWRGRSFAIPSWSNLTNYPGGREDPEIKALEASMDGDHFLERFGGEPSAPKGLVHKEFDYTKHVKRVRRVGTVAEWDAEALKGTPRDMFPDDFTVVLPEDTSDEIWIDPGYQHGYAVLFVSLFAEIAVVYHEIYKTGLYSEQMADLAIAHPRFKHVGRLVMDISGNTHAGGNRSASDVWYEKTRKNGQGMRPQTRYVPVPDGIERVRISLHPNPETGLPQLLFDESCVKTCWELAEGYRYKSDRWGEPVQNDLPQDRNNDAIKALVYGLTMNYGPARRTRINKGSSGVKAAKERVSSGWELLYDGPSTYSWGDE